MCSLSFIPTSRATWCLLHSGLLRVLLCQSHCLLVSPVAGCEFSLLKSTQSVAICPSAFPLLKLSCCPLLLVSLIFIRSSFCCFSRVCCGKGKLNYMFSPDFSQSPLPRCLCTCSSCTAYSPAWGPGPLTLTPQDRGRYPGPLRFTPQDRGRYPGPLTFTPQDWGRYRGPLRFIPQDRGRCPGPLTFTPQDRGRYPGPLTFTPQDRGRYPGPLTVTPQDRGRYPKCLNTTSSCF